MIIGNIKQLEQELRRLPETMVPWVQQLAAFDFDHMKAGRHDLIGNHYMNIDESTTGPIEERIFEAHRLYADIQYVISGDELIGYQPLCNVGDMIKSNEPGDGYFYDGDFHQDVLIHMTPGTFAIFFPGDAHRALIAPDGKGAPVRKAIMKIFLG